MTGRPPGKWITPASAYELPTQARPIIPTMSEASPSFTVRIPLVQHIIDYYPYCYADSRSAGDYVETRESMLPPNSLNRYCQVPYRVSLCWACDKPATDRCARCKTAYYCSPECQRRDWSSLHVRYCDRPPAGLSSNCS